LIAELTDTQFKESQRLAATRDELLPLLMSGRTTVKDAERRVEDET
jgi:type I restriction enzyme S subunit